MRFAITALLLLLTAGASACGGESEPTSPSRPTSRATEPPPPAPEPAPADTGEELTDAAPGGAVDPDGGPAAPLLPVGKPLLLDFTRDHCLPCEIMAPWVAEIRREHSRLVEVVEINIDRAGNKQLGLYFKARSIPTQVYVDRAGQQVSRHVGLATKEQMLRTLDRLGFLDARDAATEKEGAPRKTGPAGKSRKKRK